MTQPWASLVAIGAKRYETRSWSTSYRGLLAIHAAKGFTADFTRSDFQWKVFEPPFGRALFMGGYSALKDIPLGAIVGVVRLANVWQTSEVSGRAGLQPYEIVFGDYAPGRFAWELCELVRLATPIPCRGAHGLWTVPLDVYRQLADALKRQAA